jgi:hypothetical protein
MVLRPPQQRMRSVSGQKFRYRTHPVEIGSNARDQDDPTMAVGERRNRLRETPTHEAVGDRIHIVRIAPNVRSVLLGAIEWLANTGEVFLLRFSVEEQNVEVDVGRKTYPEDLGGLTNQAHILAAG